tara:strand:- start:13 stop:318 length:306 start_codon:yes stop_codon:yes gene_type:complete
MATLHHNISGEQTTKLISAGDDVRLSKVSLANVHGSLPCSVDLFISKENVGAYYFFKQLSLPADVAVMYDISFDTGLRGFNLFIKLTQSASETPLVDVILT